MGGEMYSRSEAREGKLKVSACICLNTAGRVDVLRNAWSATALSGGGTLNVTCCWGSMNAHSRCKEKVGIDGGRQSKEEYGSDEGFGKHLEKENKECVDKRMIVAEYARDGD
jgi:hypothetical protein